MQIVTGPHMQVQAAEGHRRGRTCACASDSNTSTPAPSPMTKPSRPVSQGRDAFSGSLLRDDSALRARGFSPRPSLHDGAHRQAMEQLCSGERRHPSYMRLEKCRWDGQPGVIWRYALT
jgi:hypothetical protein